MARPPADPATQTRSFHHSLYPAAEVAAARAERGLTVTVCLPARECSGTVGEIVGVLGELRSRGVIDEIVVVDAASGDGTAEVAEGAGAVVWQEAELMPAYGPVLGKGDAMWRALSAIDSDLVCFVDADSEDFPAHFVTGLLGPLVCEPGVSFVKAFYRRPLRAGGVSLPEGGGRVNHLTARPALRLFYPELAAIRQPLAGEVAARRELLAGLPFATGYGVEVGMLIDVWRVVGPAGIAQVDLEEHRNRSQPLSALTPMAFTVLATIARRLAQEGRLAESELEPGLDGPGLERPPLAGLAQGPAPGGDDGTAAAHVGLGRGTA
jgi:glucosyl-3-phosphoglycerate synthase